MEPAPKKRVLRNVVKSSAKGAPVKAVRKMAATKAKKVIATRPGPVKHAVKERTRQSVALLTPARKRRLTVAKTTTKDQPTRRLVKGSRAPSTRESDTSSETVTLVTGPLSLRLAEKVQIYRAWYDREVPGIMAQVAVGVGYVFILFGVLSVLLFSAPTPLTQSKFVAALLCSGSVCTNNSSTTSTSTLDQVVASPEVQFIFSGLVAPGTDTVLELIVRNAEQPVASVISLQNGTKRQLSLVEYNGNDRYKYSIPTSEMDAGEYKIQVRVKSLLGTYAEFFGPTFLVPPPPLIAANVSAGSTPSTTTTVTSPNDSNYPISTNNEAGITDQTNISNTESDISVKTIEPVMSPAPAPEAPKLERVALSPTTTVPQNVTPLPTLEVADSLKLLISSGVFPGQFKVEIVSSYRYSTIELYARLENSTQSVFLGVATRTSQNWLYWLDSASLPAGKYQITARAFDSGQLKETADLWFENTAPRLTYQTEPAYTTAQEETKKQTTEIAQSTTTPIARLVDPALPPIPTLLTSPYRATSTRVDRSAEVEKVQEILATHSSEFNELLRRYGSAIQSGDSNLIRLTEKALNERIFDLLAQEVVDSSFADSIYALEADMRRELDEVKAQIKRVENLKKERTAAASSADTDGDGISDFDEYLLYTTDPKNPDTDGDGIIDGVEISLGYDPVNEKPEAVIRFNSPKQVSYEDESLLMIEMVAPLLVFETDETVPAVQSEISGFALPNSFVTLYIFSDPIVVTVKTKDDGSFSYTFTKELADGEHEVYAALTDNKGEIVVRSSAFRFVKTAEAYTYVETERETATALTEGGLVATTRTYNTLAAMGVVSFGLILLLLGVTLRQERVKLTSVHV